MLAHETILEDLQGNHEKSALSQQDQINLSTLKVPVPVCECARIRLLREAKVFDTPPEESYDRQAAFASRVFKVSFTFLVHSTQHLNFVHFLIS